MANLHTPKLSAVFVRSAPIGKHTDSHGLMLWVQPSGSRSWVQRLVIHGKRRDMGLGGFPMVTLAEAREKAFANRRIARNGGDPRHCAATIIPTFEDATRKVHAIHAPSWKTDKQRAQWLDEVSRIVWPTIGHRKIDEITTAQIMEAINPIWLEKPVIAQRVRQRTEMVFNWAIAQGHRTDNPAGDSMKAILPKQPKGGHFAAIPHTAVSSAIRAVRNSTSNEMSKLAFEFIVLTATRSGEVREARWNEIDMDSATWTIPASRMKKAREHRIPLSREAVSILRKAREIGRGSEFVFASATGKALDGKTLRTMLTKAGVDSTIHGFRSAFRDWCSETGKARDVAEMALAHIIQDRTEAAYARSDLFDRRVELMGEWADYLSG